MRQNRTLAPILVALALLAVFATAVAPMCQKNTLIGFLIVIALLSVLALAVAVWRKKEDFDYWSDTGRLAGTSRENMSTAKFIQLSVGEGFASPRDGFISAAYPCGDAAPERFTPDAPGACGACGGNGGTGARRAAEIELAGLRAF